MASTIEINIAPDGNSTIHAATMLLDLYEDYLFFQAEASKVDRDKNPLLYKRMVRASVMAFSSYFEGVLNRWIATIDPIFDLETPVGKKLERIRQEVKKVRKSGRPLGYLNTQSPKALRNKLVHLKLGDENSDIIKELLSGQFFHEAHGLLNWLRIASHRLEIEMHVDPDKIMKPYREALGEPTRRQTAPLSEEDEELVRMAEMTFLELDAREAADGKP